MCAAPTTLDELLGHELACTPHDFERLDEAEVVGLLVARFRVLSEQGWDWASAILLATAVDTPTCAAGAPAPRAQLALVVQ